MDLGMAAVNWETMMLEYAGANNPLYVVRRGELLGSSQQIRDLLLRAQHQELRRPEVSVGVGRHAVLATDGLWTNSADRMARSSCAAASGSCWWKRRRCR